MNPVASRRQLLKLASGLPLSLPVLALADVLPDTLALHAVASQPTEAGAVRDTLVMVDTGITNFAGDGYYVYPDWGNPVIYIVRARAGRLAFHYPGSNLDSNKPLWTMAANTPLHFSGRVEALVDARMATPVSLPVLSVPALPVR